MWYARSAEFLQTAAMETCAGCASSATLFSPSALGLGWFVLGLKTGWSFAEQNEEETEAAATAGKAVA